MNKKIFILVSILIVCIISVAVSASVTTVINPIMSIYSILKVNLD